MFEQENLPATFHNMNKNKLKYYCLEENLHLFIKNIESKNQDQRGNRKIGKTRMII